MFRRIVGVFTLKPAVFEEIEHDQNATWQAALIVGLAGLLGGIGGSVAAFRNAQTAIAVIAGNLAWAYVTWLVWSLIAYVVGTSLFKGKADLGEMLRVIGYSMAPLWLGIIIFCGGLIGSLWTLVAGFIAVRQGLDLDNTSAMLTVIIGLLIYLVGYTIFNLIGGLGFLLPAAT